MMARLNIHHLRTRVPTAVLAVAMVTGSLVLAAPAAALSKHVFSTSFAGSGPSALTNPTDVVVEQSSGDVWVANPPANEQQNLKIEATEGTFTLSFGGQTSAPIRAGAFTEAIQSALEALPTVGAGNVAVYDPTAGESGLVIEFTKALSETDVSQLTASPAGLKGGTISLSTVQTGSPVSDIVKFTPSGTFVLMIGKGVNQTASETPGSSAAEENVCSAASSDTCRPGAPGASLGAFDGEFIDSIPHGGGDRGQAEHRLFLALDESPGGGEDLYVADRGNKVVQKFDSNGTPLPNWGEGGFLNGASVGEGKDSGATFSSISGIAVNTAGELVVRGLRGQFRGFIYFGQDGTFLSKGLDRAGNVGETSRGIAIDAGGSAYFTGEGLGKSSPEFEAGTNPYLNGRSPLKEIGKVSDGDILGLRADPGSRDLYAMTRTVNMVEHFGPACLPRRAGSPEEEPCTPTDTFGGGQLANPKGVSIDDATGDAYVADSDDRRIAIFSPVPFLPDASSSAAGETETTVALAGSVDPAGAGPIAKCSFEYVASSVFERSRYSNLSTGGTAPCDHSTPIASAASVAAELTGLEPGTAYHFRLSVENGAGTNTSFDHSVETRPEPPKLTGESVSGVSADVAEVHSLINPGGGGFTFHTNYHVDYGTSTSYGSEAPEPEADVGSASVAQPVSVLLSHLTPDTTYHYRTVATNVSGTTTGPDRTFTTFPFSADYQDPCPNAHVRQQTSAAGLLDCRGYELVSAADTAGYDVASNLVKGQAPFGSYPDADGRVLYGVQDGGIPGTGAPTNRGIDPYVATRGEGAWTTKYVGIPADNPFASGPFSSTPLEADAALDVVAFGGPEICSPCFEDGSTGIPVHRPDGELAQGMVAGTGVPTPPADAEPDGHIAKDLSADGTHLIFGSTALFARGGNNETGDVSIYDHNLQTGETHVVSNEPGTGAAPEPLACLQGVGKCDSAEGDANGISELDVSADGSRILLGQKVTEDAEKHAYYRLYMEINDSVSSIEVTPGASSGVLYAGMTADGSSVFFTTMDRLLPGQDTDESADLYAATVAEGGVTLSLISTGAEGAGNSDSCDPAANSARPHWNSSDPKDADCGVVAVGGGGGVASASGAVYFLSPEQLDGSSKGVFNAPNLYVARPGGAPRFVTTLESVLSGQQPPSLSHTFDHEFGSFISASGIAVDHSTGDVYVLDTESQTISKFDSSGNPVKFTAGPGAGTNEMNGSETPGGSFGTLSTFSSELAIDPTTGDFYVPDFSNSVVDKFKPSGELDKSFGNQGQVEAGLPGSVAVNASNGNIYVAQIFDFTTFAPRISVFTSAGTTVPAAGFEPTAFTPDAIAVDGSTGKVYVDQGGEEEAEVVVYSLSGHRLSTLDPDPAHSLALDPSSGTVYADQGKQIVQYDASGNEVGTVGAGHLSGSLGVAVDPEGSLYASNGASVAEFGAILSPSPLIDSPLVIDSVAAPEIRHTGDFQTNASGDTAAFPSTIAMLPEEDTADHTETYRYNASAASLACASCAVTGAASTADASLAPDGLSLTDDGRVFFTTADQLATSDTDNRQDVYEWEESGVGDCKSSSPSFGKSVGACIALVSAGTGAFDSGLLGVSSNANDAYFFTRDSLAPQDTNGPTMKIYDARVDGGFPYSFPPVACKASDECHGASSPPPGPLQVGSGTVTRNGETPKACKKGFVRKHGHCVRRRRRTEHHKRRGSKAHGGGRR